MNANFFCLISFFFVKINDYKNTIEQFEKRKKICFNILVQHELEKLIEKIKQKKVKSKT